MTPTRKRRAAWVAVGTAVLLTACGATTVAADAPGDDGTWTPLGHAVWKRCDGKTAIYVFDATSSKGGIAVTSWSSECP